MPRRIAQPRYYQGQFLDPCFYCYKYNCQVSHREAMVLYREKLHDLALKLLETGESRTGPAKYKMTLESVERRKAARKNHVPYITFTKQEKLNIKNYKPRYLPTLREEAILKRYGY